MNKKLLFFFFISHLLLPKNTFDLTIIGFIKQSDGLGRIPISIIDCLQDKIKINFIPTRQNYNSADIPKNILKIIEKNNKEIGKVIILTDVICCSYLENYKLIPDEGIKIAYSMFETSKIPSKWIDILNKKFDLVVVPDEFLKTVYKNSGIHIPIFVLPIPLYLEEFQKISSIKKRTDFFTFGCLASFDDRKNHSVLIKAFSEEFKNFEKVELKINGRSYGNNDIFSKLNIKYKNKPNIHLTNLLFSWNDYIDFFKDIHCYVNISKGEGFSISPREALAAGIPCIISNNTAQQTICRSGFVKAIECKKIEPAYYAEYGYVGNFFNCMIKDVRKALRDVYLNYNEHLKLAKKGQQWIQSYLIKNIKNKYTNLVKPKKLLLGPENKITNDYFMTNSVRLYKKYKALINEK